MTTSARPRGYPGHPPFELLTTADGTSQYGYDALDRLVQDAGAGQPETTYTYDPNGNRLTRTENGASSVLDYVPNSNRLASSDGDPQDRDAAGNRLSEEDPDGVRTEVNLRFAGQYEDRETGIYYNYYRYYNPGTGRYITSDPIGLRGGLSTYTYALNDPLYWTDPFGLDVEVLVGGAHWYDHAAVRIDNTVYSNGRYRVPGRDTGSFGLTGPNVLTVQSANSYYETSDSCNSCDTTGFKLDVTPAEEAKIKKYYQDLIAKSKKHPTRSGWYILPDDYTFVGNNCASTVVDALSSGLPWYQSMSLPGMATPQTLELNFYMSPFLVDETIHYQGGQ